MAIQLQLRHDTAANWTAANPMLAQGECGVETDTGKLKIGDGATAWVSLAYSIAHAPTGTGFTHVTAGVVDGASKLVENADVALAAAIAWTKVDKTGAVPGDVAAAAASHTHAEGDVTNLTTDLSAKAPTARQITAGAGLSGGGDLTADRTLALATPVTVPNGGTGLATLAAGLIPFGAGTSALGSDAGLAWDNTAKKLTAPLIDKGGQVYNVKAYGAVGDGTTDDTTAIQAAINAASSVDAGIVYFPVGHYKFSTLTVAKPIELRGSGWHSAPNAAFGDAQWSMLSNLLGSVLISTATSGNSIACAGGANYYGYRFSDLMIVGPGTGTSVGVSIVRGTKVRFNNVMVANFSSGYVFDGVMDSSFYDISSRGNSTGISVVNVTNASNQNIFVNTEVQFSSVNGVLVDSCALDKFYGALFQNISGTSAITVSGSTGVQALFDSVWFEVITATNAVNFSAGQGHALRDSYFTTGNININATKCIVERARTFGTGTLTVAGLNNSVVDVESFTVTDTGTNTYIRMGDTIARLGVGTTTTPTAKLSVQGNAAPGASVPTTWAAVFSGTGSTNRLGVANGDKTAYFGVGDTGAAEFSTYDYGGGGGQPLSINANGGPVTVGDSLTSTQFRLSALNTAPASATAMGTLGEIRIVSGYIYVCVATNSWQRAALAVW